MDKEEFTALADLSHIVRYANTMAVVRSISPTTTKMKLTMLKFEVADHSTADNFQVHVKLPHESLGGLLDVCKPGFILLLHEFKIVKNDGVVYGEVFNEDELSVYNDERRWLKWHSEEKEPVLSGKASNQLKLLLKLENDQFATTNMNKETPSSSRQCRKRQTLETVVVNTSSDESAWSVKQTRNRSAIKSQKIIGKPQNEETRRSERKKHLNRSSSLSNLKHTEKSTVEGQPSLVHGSRLSKSRSRTSVAKSNEKLNSNEVLSQDLRRYKQLSASVPNIDETSKKPPTDSKLTLAKSTKHDISMKTRFLNSSDSSISSQPISFKSRSSSTNQNVKKISTNKSLQTVESGSPFQKKTVESPATLSPQNLLKGKEYSKVTTDNIDQKHSESQHLSTNRKSLMKLIEKPTRRSPKTTKGATKAEVNKGVDLCRQYLRPFTREVNLKRLSELLETTLDNLEEISVPERVSLNCKVVSKFSLIEEDIEVVRVVDGSLCSNPMLILPESSTWSDLVQSVIDNTKVQKNLPFIDIIILNASRLNYTLVIDKCYHLKNLNLVKFLLAHDSRPARHIYSNEMFCFGEGQNMYPQLKSAIKLEIEKKLQSKEITEVWESLRQSGTLDNTLKAVSISSPTPNDKSTGIQERSKRDKKRKPGSDKPAEYSPASKKPKVISPKLNQVSSGMRDCNSTQCFDNPSLLSEESDIENTPSVVKELNDILLQECSTLSQSASENLMKASESELTFSQFCRGVGPVSNQIQTSTQAMELTENQSQETFKNPDELSSSGSSRKMDPLVYSPSTTSESPAPSEDIVELCSESILETKTKPVEKASVSDSTREQESRSGSVEVIRISPSPSVISSHNSSDDIQMVNIVKVDVPSQSLKANDPEECCIVSDNSSVMSELPEETVIIKSTIENEQQNVRYKPTHMLVHLENSNEKVKMSWDEFMQHIPKYCLHTSKLPHLSSFLANYQGRVENNQGNSQGRVENHLFRNPPQMSFIDCAKLLRRNYITVSVKIVSIKPHIQETWREEGIKGRCPHCKQLYSLVEANHTQSQGALSIGSHLVCPNSECSHQILENPEFHFTLRLILADNSTFTTYIGQHYADSLFGCTAQEALINEDKSKMIYEVLMKINDQMENGNIVKISLTRKDVTDPTSGPIFVHKLHF